MADYQLTDGAEVNFNLSKITMREWRELHNPTFSDDHDDEVIARVCGLDVEVLTSLPFDEYRRLFSAMVRKMANPLADPNSPSAST